MDVADFGKGTSASDYWLKGTRKNLRFTITDAGAPYDLTGLALTWYLGISDNAVPLVTKATGGGITLGQTAAGLAASKWDIAIVALTAADANFQARTYRHSLWITTAGQEEVLSRGDAVLSDSTPA